MHQGFAALVLGPILSCGSWVAGAVAQPPTTMPAGDADVPVKEVVLFSSGVGYFEHFGTVKEVGTTVLRFKTEQINDILKSLLLEDLDGGKVGTVSYPSQAPLNKTLKSFQVDITSNPPLAELLNQLRGAKVAVSAGGAPVEGIVLGVEKKRKPLGDKEAVDFWVLNLRNGRTIRPVPLDEVQSLEMDDAKLNQELDAALSALAQARDQEKKPVEIHFNGRGERRVRIGYVVETPIWKTSYRLVLDPKANAAGAGGAPAGGKLQGWAIVENQTDNDWDNVQLSLVSGRPISFIEDLYHSLYVPRPFISPQLYASLQPQTYENGISKEDMDRLQQARAANNESILQQQGQGGGGAGGGQVRVANTLFANQGQLSTQPSDTPIDPTASVVAAASASKLGELFQYTVGAVSIKRQQSAMIPIVTDEIDVHKVSIYNFNVLTNHPLNGARVKNTTHKHLLAGPVTVLEAGSYAGDAQINDVPPGQERLLSYGVDLKVLVQADPQPQQSSVQAAKLVKGVLQLAWRDVMEWNYLIDNKSDEQKTIVVEHARYPDWRLADPAKADETTDSVYRFERKLGAGKVLKLPVRTEVARPEEVQILPLDPAKLEVFVKLDKLPQKVRDALMLVIEMKQAVAVTELQIRQRDQRILDVTNEQSRIRENMKTVSQSTDYYARLIKKLDEQETQIETMQKDVSGLQKQLESQRKELETKVGQLTID
jgi:hypothetical protein